MGQDEEPGFRRIGRLLSEIETSVANVGSILTRPSPPSEITGLPSPVPTPPKSTGGQRGATGVATRSGSTGRVELRGMPRTIEEQEAKKRLCVRYLQELHNKYAPASANEIASLLKALCGVFGTPEGFDISAEIYIELLPYPLLVLNDAVKHCLRTSKWFPKPADLIELCEPLMADIRWKLGDAESDLAYVSQELPVPREVFYRNQGKGDGHGSAGSSALRATDVLRVVEPLGVEKRKEIAETLKNWPKIPVPEDLPMTDPAEAAAKP